MILTFLAASVGQAQRPNFVFIFTDDQAPAAIGVSGHPHAKTPKVDRLAREGAYLVNASTTTPELKADPRLSQPGTRRVVSVGRGPRRDEKPDSLWLTGDKPHCGAAAHSACSGHQEINALELVDASK